MLDGLEFLARVDCVPKTVPTTEIVRLHPRLLTEHVIVMMDGLVKTVQVHSYNSCVNCKHLLIKL